MGSLLWIGDQIEYNQYLEQAAFSIQDVDSKVQSKIQHTTKGTSIASRVYGKHQIMDMYPCHKKVPSHIIYIILHRRKSIAYNISHHGPIFC